jgi:hypothetical protein
MGDAHGDEREAVEAVSLLPRASRVDATPPFEVDQSWPSKPGLLVLSMASLWVLMVGTRSAGEVDRASPLNAVESAIATSTGSAPQPSSFWLETTAIDSAGARYGQLASVQYYPWDRIVEPHKTTELQLSNSWLSEASAEYNYTWTVAGHSAQGRAAHFTFTKVGHLHTVRLVAASELSEPLEFNAHIMCKYVRRELRSLSTTDREALLASMRSLWETPSDSLNTGHNIAWFTEKHLAGAASRDCDHWHDGAGVYTHHAAFSIEFEKTLQAIDSSVALAYWDYSIDAQTFGSNYSGSVIFSDDWFGALPSFDGKDGGKATSHVVTSGRWAFLNVPKTSDAAREHGFGSARGLLRSPWNLESSPYVTRSQSGTVLGTHPFQTFPDCLAFSNCYLKRTLADMSECLNGATHGSVHVIVGGHWGLGSGITADAKGEPASLSEVGWSRGEQVLLIAKNLWRQGFIQCPNADDSTCAGGSDSATECTCSCPAEARSGMTAYDVLYSAGVLHWLQEDTSNLPDTPTQNATSDTEAWEALLSTICSMGRVGDMFTSASPLDPLFWVIHPTGDRLVAARRLAALGAFSADNATNPFVHFDETWGYAHATDTASDVGIVCDWSDLSNATGRPKCSLGDCKGHGEFDVLPFTNLSASVTEQEDVVGGYTNRQIYELLHPHSPELPYVYDSFAWPHCTHNGTALFGASIEQ